MKLYICALILLVAMAEAVPSGMSMFEISARPWLYNLSVNYNRPITKLSDIPVQEFKNIAAKGYDMVWMMGVWSLGQYGITHDQTDSGLLQHYGQVLPGYTKADIIGSPYAVTSYTCNPELGSDSDITALRKTLNSLGLKLMLDYVPNHTAVDCPWSTSEPSYYVQVAKGTQPPYDKTRYTSTGLAYGWAGWGSAWTDTLQINIWNPATRAARTQEVIKVASLADAIRCDMAFLLLNNEFQQIWGSQVATYGYSRPSTEWWADTISAVKKSYPNTIFLAEVYSPNEGVLQGLGFDYTYDKQLYDKLTNGAIGPIISWISGQSASYTTHSAHFVSNHDEQRAVSNFGGWDRAAAAALVSYTLPGMRFFWMGDSEGYKNQLDVHLRREQAEPAQQAATSFYARLLSVVNTPVFKQGTWAHIPVQNSETLFAYTWTLGSQKRACVLNYSGAQAWGVIVLANAAPVNGNDTIPVTDLMTGTTYYRSANEIRTKGLNVGVNQWFGSVFEY